MRTLTHNHVLLLVESTAQISCSSIFTLITHQHYQVSWTNKYQQHLLFSHPLLKMRPLSCRLAKYLFLRLQISSKNKSKSKPLPLQVRLFRIPATTLQSSLNTNRSTKQPVND